MDKTCKMMERPVWVVGLREVAEQIVFQLVE